VTIDVMGCQKGIAADIVAKQGGYTLALKENHPEVYGEARERFESIDEGGCSFPPYTEVTKDQGRIERQEAWLCTDVSWFGGLTAWTGLMTMGGIRSVWMVKGVGTTEMHYYLTTLTEVEEFARSVRSHWRIENKLHWVLDVAFREDYARNRKEHSAANLTILRKITLNLLRLEPTEKYGKRKLSLNRKRLYASYEPDFLLKILFNL
jgi:predicted transposase YbfD/YdcC